MRRHSATNRPVGQCRAQVRNRSAAECGAPPDVEGTDMADLAFIALTVVFFAAVALVARRLDRS